MQKGIRTCDHFHGQVVILKEELKWSSIFLVLTQHHVKWAGFIDESVERIYIRKYATSQVVTCLK